MMSQAWQDDDRLMAELSDALHEQGTAPPEVVAAAKAVYTWRTIDAELAALSYDSVLDDRAELVLRSEAATLRTLTFESPTLTVEVGVTATALVGQLVPSEAGTVLVQTADGPGTSLEVDDLGCFTVDPVPSGSFRLQCQLGDGRSVVTDWVTL